MRLYSKFLLCSLIGVFLSSCEPPEPQWKYVERIITPSSNPYGIAWYEGEIVFSCPESDEIAFLDKEKIVRTRFKEFIKPRRLNTTGNELIVAESAENRIGLYSDNDVMYYPLTNMPDAPMAASFGKSKVAVADYNKHRIVYFKGSNDLTFGSHGIDEGQFKYPTDVQIFGNKLYVADNMNRRIQVFDDDGKYVKSIGEDSGIEQASGLFVYSGGVILCDRKGSQIFWFDHSGKQLQKVNEGFETPSDAVVVGDKLYVSDEVGGYIAVMLLN